MSPIPAATATGEYTPTPGAFWMAKYPALIKPKPVDTVPPTATALSRFDNSSRMLVAPSFEKTNRLSEGSFARDASSEASQFCSLLLAAHRFLEVLAGWA